MLALRDATDQQLCAETAKALQFAREAADHRSVSGVRVWTDRMNAALDELLVRLKQRDAAIREQARGMLARVGIT